jgi:hypothetical protein
MTIRNNIEILIVAVARLAGLPLYLLGLILGGIFYGFKFGWEIGFLATAEDFKDNQQN